MSLYLVDPTLEKHADNFVIAPTDDKKPKQPAASNTDDAKHQSTGRFPFGTNDPNIYQMHVHNEGGVKMGKRNIEEQQDEPESNKPSSQMKKDPIHLDIDLKQKHLNYDSDSNKSGKSGRFSARSGRKDSSQKLDLPGKQRVKKKKSSKFKKAS